MCSKPSDSAIAAEACISIGIYADVDLQHAGWAKAMQSACVPAHGMPPKSSIV